jgi:hypothetical protein
MNREDFPMLDGDIIYLDNGATSLKPKCVIDKIVDYYSNYSANAHRGDYDISFKVDLEYENSRELVGAVSNCRSINVCRQAALNNAAAYYASLAGSHLKGRVVSDVAVNQSDNDSNAEFDKLYAAYERCVEKEIKGEMIESYTISRTNGETGQKELQTYFIVNESEATKARIRAWENAQKESEAAQKYATEVSKFINEGFVVE